MATTRLCIDVTGYTVPAARTAYCGQYGFGSRSSNACGSKKKSLSKLGVSGLCFNLHLMKFITSVKILDEINVVLSDDSCVRLGACDQDNTIVTRNSRERATMPVLYRSDFGLAPASNQYCALRMRSESSVIRSRALLFRMRVFITRRSLL